MACGNRILEHSTLLTCYSGSQDARLPQWRGNEKRVHRGSSLCGEMATRCFGGEAILGVTWGIAKNITRCWACCLCVQFAIWPWGWWG